MAKHTSEALADQLHSLISLAIEDGLLDPDSLRILCAGLAPSGDAINLFYRNGWGQYWPFDADEAFASIPLDDWLERIDRLAAELPGRDFEEPFAEEVAGLRRTVQEALRLIAVREPLCDSPQAVCLGEQGFGPFGEWYPVAFGHRAGAGTLLPLMEKRDDSKLIYPWGSLTDDGITLFFPEGEGDALAAGLDGAPEASVRSFPFAEMTASSAAGGPWESGITFRMRGEVAPRVLQAGHTHEEWGYPDDDQVNALLARHLERRPEILFDWRRYPQPADTAAVESWHAFYAASDLHEGEDLVRLIVEAHGLDAVASFVERLPTDATDRADAYEAWATLYADRGEWQRAWEILAPVAESERRSVIELRARVALQLGLVSEGLAAAAALKEKSEGRGLFYECLLRSREEPAAALELARELVADSPQQSMSHYALAYVLQKNEADEAAAAFDEAMRCNDRYFLESFFETDFGDHAAISARVAEFRRQQALHRAHAEQLQRVSRKVRFQPIGLDGELDESQTWEPIAVSDIDGLKEVHDLAQPDPGTVLIAGWKEGLFQVDLAQPEAAKRTLHLETEAAARGVASDGQIAYVANGTGLMIASLAGDGARWLDPALPLLDLRTQSVAHHAELVAGIGSDAVDLYGVEGPGKLRVLSSIGSGAGHFTSGVFHRGHLLLSDLTHGLVVVDLSDPETPLIAAALGSDDPDLRCDSVFVHGDRALVSTNDCTLLYDVSDPAAPEAVGMLRFSIGRHPPLGSPALAGKGAVLLADSNANLWTVELTPAPRVTAVAPLSSLEHDDVSLYGGEFGVLAGEHLVRFSEQGYAVAFAPRSREAWDGVARIQAMRVPLLAWVEARLAELAEQTPGRPIGVLSLMTWYGKVALRFDCMRSRPGLVPWQACDEPVPLDQELPEFDIELEQLAGQLPVPPTEPPETTESESRRMRKRIRAAWEACFVDLFADLKKCDAFAEVASGRVFLVVGIGEYAARVLDTALLPDKAWQPHRPQASGFAKPAMQTLLAKEQGYRFARVAHARALRDRGDREAIWALAREGRPSALAVATWLFAEHPDESMAALCEAAAAGFFDVDGVALLGRDTDAPETLALLETALKDDDVRIQLAAARTLDRLDAPELLAAVREGLSSNRGTNMAHALDAAEALPDENLAALRPVLLDLVENIWSGHPHIARLARLLFRAGHPTIPPRLAALAAREREQESEGGLFGELLARRAPLSTADAERLWSARALAGQIGTLHSTKDAASSLLPSALTAETKRFGWKKLLAMTWPQLEEAVVDWAHATLAAHARQGTQVSERPLAVAALSLSMEEKEPPRERLSTLAGALADGDDVSSDGRELATAALRWLRLQRGWDLLGSEDLAGARALADEVLAAAPSDPEALFLQARLIWIAESPVACEAHVAKLLARLDRPRSRYEQRGRAKLLNLRGCACDELGDAASALDCFEEAARLDPREPIFLANIAELHDKAGRPDLARKLAQQAVELGYRSAVIERILA